MTHAPCDGSDTQQFETFRYAGADVWRSRDGLWLHQDPDSKGLLACTALNEKAQINQVPLSQMDGQPAVTEKQDVAHLALAVGLGVGVPLVLLVCYVLSRLRNKHTYIENVTAEPEPEVA